MRPTVRLRLTALYGGLFLLSSLVLVALVYVLVASLPAGVPPPDPPPGLPALDLPEPTLPDWMRDRLDEQRADELRRLLVGSGFAVAVMAVVSLGLGWLLAGRVLRPLGTMTATVRRISADDLDRRLAAAGPDDELRELADTFDALLGRLAAAFAAQSRFIANASHELRTPLAFQRALVEVTLADPGADADALRAALRRVLRAGEEQERLIEALLMLARSQQGLRERADVDLVAACRAALEGLGDDRGRVDIRVDGALDAGLGGGCVRGDPQLIERLVGNLLENAVRHHVPDGRVELSLAARDGVARLRVANPGGRPVPPDEVDELLEPFRRGQPDRRADRRGAGLGLSIVAAVATAHGGTVALHALPPGGLAVTVDLPVPPPVSEG